MKKKAELSILITSLQWCVLGRGIHEHFSFFKLKQSIKFKNRYNNQRTKCFCTRCDNELCGSNSHSRSVVTEKGAFEIYICSICKTENIFRFDMPVPFLVDTIH